MTHYNLLKLKPGADADAIFAQCEAVYAALEVFARRQSHPLLHCARFQRGYPDDHADRPAGAARHVSAAPQACRPGTGDEGQHR